VNLATPTRDDHAEWVLLELAEPSDGPTGAVDDQRWTASTDGRAVRRRPGRESRREGLRLVLSTEPLLVVQGFVPDVVVTLQNSMLETWHADPDDDGWVIAALTDEDGGPEGRLGWFALGLAPRLPDLPPRGSVTLAAWILRSSIQGAAPGCYGMVASLSSLGLRSNVRPVEVLTDPRHESAPSDV